ncbi:MAG: hypothetical protein A3C97_02575 [Candidatus Levybacteria bacterium RIFCSPHIGHO2_02_FULL_37_11]|nr:MAG: hypothetical protein A3C97_02575 [Candidatus Levybacteria bacterium RIFCSPHIGHO2_02_FULL_37_11]
MKKNGFSVIEVILAAALFMIIATGSITVILQGLDSNRLGEEQTVANQYATEGMEAVRSIKNQNFANLVNSAGTGVAQSGGVWIFSGTNNTNTFNPVGKYTRAIKVESVYRDAVPPAGNIVTSGTLDPDTKKITSTVSWNFTPSRANSVQLISYLSDWRKPITPSRGGILVYGDGGTTTDAIKYKIFDPDTGTWGAATATADVDVSTTNKALRVARVFASSTRDEKVLVTRHYNGSSHFIYAQVFNSTGWSNVQLLFSWASTSFLNVRNFDGTYLSNGNFMVVYSDNTTTPKYRIWNGASWGSQTNAVNVGGIPTYIVAKARPNNNEVMIATFDQTSDTNTAYFNGSSWSAAVQHSSAAPTNTKEHIDFAWSLQNALKGAMVYPGGGTDSTQDLKIWTANGSGSGSWSATSNAPNLGGRLGAVDIDGRRGAEEFVSCQKNANNKIGCFLANTTPGWSTPANNTLTNNTEGGIQRSYNFAFEDSGSEGVVVYSDNTSTPKLKKYVSSSNSFDATPSNLDTLGGVLTTIRMRPLSDSEDIFIFMATGNTLYSVLWDGTGNVVYILPTGKAFITHGTNGSATTDFWYDFAWDKF